MRISVAALGDVFGRGRLTPRAKAGIEHALNRAGVAVVPSLLASPDGWVTLRAVTPVSAMPPTVLGAVADEVRALPRPRVPASLAAAMAFLVPVLLAGAFHLPAEGGATPPATTPVADTRDPKTLLLDRANTALLAGDYVEALKLSGRADPARVPKLEAQIIESLLTQAHTAQRGRAYVRAIKLARRAARFGRAPGAGTIVRQSRAGLDLRREAMRRTTAGG